MASRNNNGIDVGALAEEKLCEKDEEVRKKSGQYEDQTVRKIIPFIMKWNMSAIYETLVTLFLVWRNFMLPDFEGVCVEYGIGEINFEGRRLLKFCYDKEFCVANT